MKKIIISLSLLVSLTSLYAQDKSTEKADLYFETYQYIDAIKEYEKLAENKKANTYIYTQLAESNYNIFNIEEAAKWYAKAVKSSKKLDAEVYYRYAQALKSMGKYNEANAQMDAFAKLAPTDSRAKEYKANPDYIPSLMNQTKLFDVAETSIQDKEQSSFGAFLTNDNTLYFTSTMNSNKKKDNWTGQAYLDIFTATRNADGTLSKPEGVSELNTPFHDGPVTISADGNTMFFARDGHSEGQYQKDKSKQTKVGQQGLYKATKSNGKWSNIQALPFNSTSYSVTNPSLSPDGTTLYFASNMPGGLGQSDIWKVSIKGTTYGKPENLGPLVNSKGQENFPFIAEDDFLYFSSNGKQGFGGLDVFKIDLKKKKEALNVGKPLNGEMDDFSFSWNTKQNVGFFSSNRKGADAIYSATAICQSKTTIVVTNKKTGAVISNANVTILDAKGNSIETQKSNAEGQVFYTIDCETPFTLQVSADNFDSATYTLAQKREKETNVKVELIPEEVIITDTEVVLKSIFFDFNKSNITAQGATELNKLVNVMKNHSSMIIFVKSHTDSKGKPAYNLNLSEQRAQATVQYIISKGIDSSRISGKGFGDTEPKINCKKCTDTEDAMNRRSEFLIVKK